MNGDAEISSTFNVYYMALRFKDCYNKVGELNNCKQ